jgi:hypothetical protein
MWMLHPLALTDTLPCNWRDARVRAPRLIACDLDGTLLDAACRLPPGHGETVAWLRDRGIAVVIVTGRPLLTTLPVYRQLGLDTPLVCFNGVWVGHPVTGTIAERPLDEPTVRAAIALLRNRPGSICVYPGMRWLMHRFTDRTRAWPELYGVTIEEAPAIVESWTGTSCKVMFVAEPSEIAATESVLRRELAGRCHIALSQPDRLEVIPAGVDKAVGLGLLCTHLGIPRKEVWAVGDAGNDLEMLRWAGRGFAMGHAPAAVRAAADAVLPSIDKAGITDLRRLIEG